MSLGVIVLTLLQGWFLWIELWSSLLLPTYPLGKISVPYCSVDEGRTVVCFCQSDTPVSPAGQWAGMVASSRVGFSLLA